MAGGELTPVRVAFVSSHAQPGGAERYLELLIERLGASWIAGVVTLQQGPFVERLRERFVPVQVVPTGARLGVLPASVRLRRRLRALRPDVVHANNSKAALVSILATRGMAVPVVWVKHDVSFDGTRLADWLGRRSALVVGVSELVLSALRDRPEVRTLVVPNGIPDVAGDRDAGRALVRGLIGEEPAEVVALVGRLHPGKGQLELVEAAPRVLERRPQARFLLVGGEDRYRPGYLERVRRRVAELGLEEAFTFASHHPDAPAVMAGCDVVAVPSLADEQGVGREGFGLVGVEAMAAGTPVVGYADGALPEVLGECARLVPVGDRAALADAIAAVLEDPAERRRMADCGRIRVRERYRLDGMVEAMRGVYSELARPSPDGGSGIRAGMPNTVE